MNKPEVHKAAMDMLYMLIGIIVLFVLGFLADTLWGTLADGYGTHLEYECHVHGFRCPEHWSYRPYNFNLTNLKAWVFER